MEIKELKQILDKMISKVKYGFQDEKWYEPLINLGIIDEPEILSDPYYDGEAVVFARDLLDLVTVDNEKEIVRSLLEILSNAKQIEAKAEEKKPEAKPEVKEEKKEEEKSKEEKKGEEGGGESKV